MRVYRNVVKCFGNIDFLAEYVKDAFQVVQIHNVPL